MPQAARKHAYGGPMHRMVNKPVTGRGARVHLHPDHPAYVEARTLFPSRVIAPQDSPRLLVAGFNQRKIGARVTKGRWSGLPLYTLTLEERATCPRSCLEWATCYGNNMYAARRHRHGLPLEVILVSEVVDMERRHPAGFVVRLHILGDFYSVAYAELWGILLRHCPQLRVFGFTARAQGSEIGRAVAELNAAHRDRCRIRFSGTDTGPTGALVIAAREDSQHILCPVQTGRTDCCGTCGLCWTAHRTIEFVRH